MWHLVFLASQWELKFKKPAQNYWLADSNAMSINMPLIFDPWSSCLQLTDIHESVLDYLLVSTSVKISDHSQFLIHLFHRITYIIEEKCFVPIEIDTLSSNLPFTSTMLWSNMPFLDSGIGLVTTMLF